MKTGATILCTWMVALYATAQDSGSVLRKNLQDTASVLSQVKSDGAASLSRLSSDQAISSDLTQRLSARADSLPGPASSPYERSQALAVNDRMSRNSTDGQMLLAQNGPALRAPDEDAPKPPKAGPGTAQRAPDEAGQPAAPAKQGGKDAPTEIVITCQGATFFDSAQALGEFTDDVELHHPQFHLVCDELEVYMLKDNEKPKPEASPPPPPGANTKAAEPAPDNSIKQAIARGRRVVIEKLSEDGMMQTGVCRHVTYVGSNGDVYMRDMPQVQKGGKLIRSASPGTYFILKQNGRLFTYGPTFTDIIQEPEKKAAATPGAPGGAPAAPAPPKP